MVKRNTKQRTGIMDFLMTRKDHPTAEVVYRELRKSFPKISLGTVYRNLNVLAEEGEILKLRFDDGLDHFDANTDRHHHFICRECGAVEDLYDIKADITLPEEKYDGDVKGFFVYFYGSCPACKQAVAN